MTDFSSHAILIGGGHAHVAVLADWAKSGCPAARATLITPQPFLRYSGMVPGWIAGAYSRDEALVDLAALAKAAGVKLVLDRCIAIDPTARSILTLENGAAAFDIASIDVGGAGRAAKIIGTDQRLIDVRPIDGFVDQLERALSGMEEGADKPLSIAVIGGGAGGAELAFALRNRLGTRRAPDVQIVTGEGGLLPEFSNGTKRRVLAEMKRQNIRVVNGDASLASGQLTAGGRLIEPADLIIAAIGSAAPDWPRAGGLAADEAGFITVDRYQRSISHSHIFASGDCAMRTDRLVPHSGVHAVRTGPVLAANLRSVINGAAPTKSYTPRPFSLYLLAAGTGEAIASYGPLAAQGRWAGGLKAWIDRRWIAQYARLSEGV